MPTDAYRTTVLVLRSNVQLEETIAKLICLDLRTLRKRYREELACRRATVTAALGSVIVNAALNGDWHSALAWLSRRGGEQWRKVERREHAGLEGAPIKIETRGRVIIVSSDGGELLAARSVVAATAGAVVADVLVEDDRDDVAFA